MMMAGSFAVSETPTARAGFNVTDCPRTSRRLTISVAKDGTVTGIESGFKPGAATVLGRIKLVNPPQENIVRGDDGLFRLKDGTTPDADANVALVGGALENSNVNVVDAMVDMISLARQFELQMSMLKNVESNDTKAAQIMSLS